ncbi:hypothetical protein [Cellulomonas aerilata]|nr:hypothetical protein [Cellulomonas aerilata]
MTSSRPAMIVSGVPYAVTELEGKEPATLEAFAGPITMHTQGSTGDHEICGDGEDVHDGVVRVHEKDHHGTGKDVRVWAVSASPDEDGFVAAG